MRHIQNVTLSAPYVSRFRRRTDAKVLGTLAAYLVFFGVATRLFLVGRHVLAYVVLFGVFLILLGWVLRQDWRGGFHG